MLLDSVAFTYAAMHLSRKKNETRFDRIERSVIQQYGKIYRSYQRYVYHAVSSYGVQ